MPPTYPTRTHTDKQTNTLNKTLVHKLKTSSQTSNHKFMDTTNGYTSTYYPTLNTHEYHNSTAFQKYIKHSHHYHLSDPSFHRPNLIPTLTHSTVNRPCFTTTSTNIPRLPTQFNLTSDKAPRPSSPQRLHTGYNRRRKPIPLHPTNRMSNNTIYRNAQTPTTDAL